MLATTVMILDGALASSVAITLDVLAMANRQSIALGRSAVFDVRLTGSGAEVFRPFLALPEANPARPDLLIIPAQGFSKSPDYAARLAAGDVAHAQREIHEAADAGALLTSSCTGALLLASTGLLTGRRATTAWWLAPDFKAMFPDVILDTGALVVTDGPFTTAGAAMAQMDLTVGLVARHAGADVADACARRMILDERRSQVPYMAIGLLAAREEAVARAADWARARLADPVGVNDLAAAVGLTPRTFARRVRRATGLSPMQFLQQLRSERALELIETTRLSVEEIAFRVGYADPSSLRGVLRRSLGMGPREIRERGRPARADLPRNGAALVRASGA